MSFGNIKIFPFPAVQYIPLSLTLVSSGPIVKMTPRTQQPQLLVGSEIIKWRESLQAEYGIDINPSQTDSYPLLALNLSVNDVKYRSFYVTMTGQKALGFYHYYTLPRNYFYKNNLFFELFDLETAKRIGCASTILK